MVVVVVVVEAGGDVVKQIGERETSGNEQQGGDSTREMIASW
jgi:hypothetical protein